MQFLVQFFCDFGWDSETRLILRPENHEAFSTEAFLNRNNQVI